MFKIAVWVGTGFEPRASLFCGWRLDQWTRVVLVPELQIIGDDVLVRAVGQELLDPPGPIHESQTKVDLGDAIRADAEIRTCRGDPLEADQKSQLVEQDLIRGQIDITERVRRMAAVAEAATTEGASRRQRIHGRSRRRHLHSILLFISKHFIL